MPNRPSARPAAATLLLAALALLPTALHAQRSTAALSLGMMLPSARAPLATVVVPDVRGQTLSGAAARVAVAGLVPRHAASTTGNVDTSPVRRQWPRAGQRVPEGTVVALELGTPLAALAAATERVAGGAAAENPGMARLARASLSAGVSTRTSPPRARAAAWWAVAVTAVLAVVAALGGDTEARPTAAAPRGAAAGGTYPALPAQADREPDGPLGGVWLRARRRPPRLVVVSREAVAAGAERMNA